MPEKMQIVIEPPQSHPDFLTIQDAMEQVLDYFQLASAGEPQGSQTILWKLISISMQSPLVVTAEAYSFDPAINADEIAQKQMKKLNDGLKSILVGVTPHEWTSGEASNIIERVLKRNKNGIGKTRIITDFQEGSLPIEITPQVAESAITEIHNRPLRFLQEDLSHKEYGSVDGYLIAVGSDYGKPAIMVKDRLTNGDVLCRVPEETRSLVSKNMQLDDVWRNQRVLVTGLISFEKDGRIRRVYNAQIESIVTKEVSVDDIRDEGFTNGLSPYEYLDKLREGNLG